MAARNKETVFAFEESSNACSVGENKCIRPPDYVVEPKQMAYIHKDVLEQSTGDSCSIPEENDRT